MTSISQEYVREKYQSVSGFSPGIFSRSSLIFYKQRFCHWATQLLPEYSLYSVYICKSYSSAWKYNTFALDLPNGSLGQFNQVTLYLRYYPNLPLLLHIHLIQSNLCRSDRKLNFLLLSHLLSHFYYRFYKSFFLIRSSMYMTDLRRKFFSVEAEQKIDEK